jgi:hypothetical protein
MAVAVIAAALPIFKNRRLRRLQDLKAAIFVT